MFAVWSVWQTRRRWVRFKWILSPLQKQLFLVLFRTLLLCFMSTWFCITLALESRLTIHWPTFSLSTTVLKTNIEYVLWNTSATRLSNAPVWGIALTLHTSHIIKTTDDSKEKVTTVQFSVLLLSVRQKKSLGCPLGLKMPKVKVWLNCISMYGYRGLFVWNNIEVGLYGSNNFHMTTRTKGLYWSCIQRFWWWLMEDFILSSSWVPFGSWVGTSEF